MNIEKMIDTLQGQKVALEEAITSLEKLAMARQGAHPRGRPPSPRCPQGCGKPVHRGKCRGMRVRKVSNA